MTKQDSNFYVVGGTLRLDAKSYIYREADEELFSALRQNKFCYVLTSRQMGKSSLMVRAAVRLRKEGTSVVVLDLTQIGQNLVAEQWYDGLLFQIGQQLGIDVELDDFWNHHRRLGPMQRLMEAIQKVVLPRCFNRLVVFIDEIDAVLSLSFPTNEFFAGIRQLYNRRAENKDLERLTFCLLGVATPSDLIKEARTTPFNIGLQISLTDFSYEEAKGLIRGLKCNLRLAERVLERILYWTNGHPYLTQRLCQEWTDKRPFLPADRDPNLTENLWWKAAIAINTLGLLNAVPAINRRLQVFLSSYRKRHVNHWVDEFCEGLFLSASAQKRDTNLTFVRDYLLRKDADTAALLTLYNKVRQKGFLESEDANPLFGLLRLSGVVWEEAGIVYLRNRIYAHVFDNTWVIENMPESERRRQRIAYRKGIIRATITTASISAAVLVMVIGLVMTVSSRTTAREWGYKYEALKRELERTEKEKESSVNEANMKINRAVRQAQELQIILEETRAVLRDVRIKNSRKRRMNRTAIANSN